MPHESQIKKDMKGLVIFLARKREIYINVKIADNQTGEASSNDVTGKWVVQGGTEIKKSLLKKSTTIIIIPIEEIINIISSFFLPMLFDIIFLL